MLLSNAALYYVTNATVHCHYYLKQLIIKNIFLNKEIVFLFIEISCPILFISFCRLKMIIFLLPEAFFFLLFLAVLLRWLWILSSFVCVVSCIAGELFTISTTWEVLVCVKNILIPISFWKIVLVDVGFQDDCFLSVL